MAHKVMFSTPHLELGSADVTFRVRKNNALLGYLKISKGAVVWKPSQHQGGHKIHWDHLADLLREHGRRLKR